MRGSLTFRGKQRSRVKSGNRHGLVGKARTVSPLQLILCPSVMVRRGKYERKVVFGTRRNPVSETDGRAIVTRKAQIELYFDTQGKLDRKNSVVVLTGP